MTAFAVIGLAVVAYVAAGVWLRPRLGRMEMFESMAGFDPDEPDASERGIAALAAPFFAVLALLHLVVAWIGRRG